MQWNSTALLAGGIVVLAILLLGGIAFGFSGHVQF